MVFLGIDCDRMGVICQYKSQAAQIQSLLADHPQQHQIVGIKVSTVDAFQGAEKDVILLTCSRTTGRNLQHLESAERINVALTRARHHMLIIGCVKALESARYWSNIISRCRDNKRLFTADDLGTIFGTTTTKN